MTILPDHEAAEPECAAWLQVLRVGLRDFSRSELYGIGQTPEREWWLESFEQPEELANKLTALARTVTITPSGCWELRNHTPARVTFRGRRLYAYQLVYWGGNQMLPAEGEVVRHRCHNRRCINPNHLEHGTQRDNVHDEIEKMLGSPD